MDYVVIMLIGALAAILANKGIAVFNDGFRPIVPQYFEGRMSRKELAATSFAISFGLVVGFGIPTSIATSIAASIILIHSILLATDIIGTMFKDDLVGMVLSGVVGAVYGLGILVGLQFVVDAFAMLPLNFLGNLGAVSTPVVAAFAAFPAVAVAMQHDFKKGSITGIIIFITWFIVKKFGVFAIGSANVALNAEGIAMLVGTLAMLFFASKQKSDATTSQELTSVFSEKS